MNRSPLTVRTARTLAGGLCASLFLAASVPAATPSDRRAPAGQAEPEKDTVKKLFGLRWHGTLDGALEEARKSKRPRPVFWLRMLGDLAGKT